MVFKGNEPEGQPVTPETPGQEPEVETQTPGYVTQDVLEQKLKALGDELKNALNENYRGVQKQTDRFQDRVAKMVQTWEESAKKSGITITDAQRQQMETIATTQALGQPDSAGGNAVPQPGQAVPSMPPDASEDMVNNAAEAYMKAYGVPIEEGDPEVSYLDAASHGTPAEYMDAVHAAVSAKRKRLAGTVGTTPPGNPMARTPGVVAGKPQSNPIQNVTGDELWKLHSQKRGG